MCVRTSIGVIVDSSFIHCSRTRTIFKRKLYTRGVVTTLSRAEISSTHSVANWNNVTEATVELVQYRNVDIEHELLID